MNILFLTETDGHPWAGPSFSVPQQILSQSKLDNVFWYNYYGDQNPKFDNINIWRKKEYYHDLTEFPKYSLDSLPAPFSAPDVIVFEGFYGFTKNHILSEIYKRKIPYIIVPRCELTKKAQRRHWYKKVPCNILFNYKFARNAAAIQYLTEDEAITSGKKWNKNFFVIPNGCIAPTVNKTSYSCSSINGVYIGRIEYYQKGLDMLLEAINMKKELLRENNFYLSIYGPNKEKSVNKLNNIISKNKINDLVCIDPRTIVGEEKEHILLSNDVFFLTSRFEGHPMALIEALAYGLPACITDGSNMRGIVEEHDAGWGAKNETESIAKMIEKMITEKEKICKKGENAKKLSIEYEWDNIALLTHEKLSMLG